MEVRYGMVCYGSTLWNGSMLWKYGCYGNVNHYTHVIDTGFFFSDKFQEKSQDLVIIR